MGGDYTRFTFDPASTYSGVHKQQGRVSLDSDFNEFEEILDRRSRAEMHDIVGRPVVPKTTPTGFEIGVSGTHLTIGIGRAYVDGILAECFGDMQTPAATVRDDHIGGVVGSGPVDYASQPFFYQPNPPGPPTFPALSSTAGDINLLYLDVWQREVTVWEAEKLRDPALNGRDTATRVQTAWQVKALPGANLLCRTPPATWAALIAPSTARLTAQAPAAVTPAPGPCVITPVGGYTGLENRLYRIEVHQGGTLGGGGGTQKVQFKWSRDNASLVASVSSITIQAGPPIRSVITVNSTGHDSWLRFEVGDHLELLDDDIEFAMRESGVGGTMATITSVNHATGEIQVDANLTGFAVNASRHPRVRRWDRDPLAVTPEPLLRDWNGGAAIALENGIVVTFGGAASDTLHAGDYWVFAARTATGEIDALVSAPPRGILHHFAKLALVESGATPIVRKDCRVFWPLPTCCSVVVMPGDDIQAAIDSLGSAGGCVCLKMGVHPITAPLVINKSRITLHAEAPETIVRMEQGAGVLMLDIGSVNQNQTIGDINVMGISFQNANPVADGQAAIRLRRVRKGRIESGSVIVSYPPALAAPIHTNTAIDLRSCSQFAIESTQIIGFTSGIHAEECDDVEVVDNELRAPVRQPRPGPFGGGTAESAGERGIWFLKDAGAPVGIAVERNDLHDFRRGIELGRVPVDVIANGTGQVLPIDDNAMGSRIAGNVITRQGAPTTNLPEMFFGIATHVVQCEIVENSILITAQDDGGIVAAGGDVLVARNEVRSTLTFDPTQAPCVPRGVFAYNGGGDSLRCIVKDNYFAGFQQPILAGAIGTNAPGPAVDIISNRIDGTANLKALALSSFGGGSANPLVRLLINSARYGSIVVYNVDHVKIFDNMISTGVCGTIAVSSPGARLAGNRVQDCVVGALMDGQFEASGNTIDAPTSAGFLVFGGDHAVLRGNVLNKCPVAVLDVAGVGTRIEGNEVSGGNTGIVQLLVVDGDVRDNTIEDVAETGIATLAALHVSTVSGNRLLRCGREAPGHTTSVATGIFSLLTLGIAVVEGNHVIDTGDNPTAGATPFAGPRWGVLAAFAAGVRVHGCTIASRAFDRGAAGPNVLSRGLVVVTFSTAIINLLTTLTSVPFPAPYADAVDNHVHQTTATLVQLRATGGDVMFASNRCTNAVLTNPGRPSVILAGGQLVVNGNRVKAAGATPSLRLAASHALAVVGNMSTAGASLSGAAPVPAPYNSFNVTA